MTTSRFCCADMAAAHEPGSAYDGCVSGEPALVSSGNLGTVLSAALRSFRFCPWCGVEVDPKA
jgi:hypothetical protein